MKAELQMAGQSDSGLTHQYSSQTKWVNVRKLPRVGTFWRLMVYIQWNDHNHRLLIAGFDWILGLSLGRNLSPFGDGSVSVFVPRSSNYAQLHVFIWEWRRKGEGGGGEGGGCHVKKSFWRCSLQFRSCSIPTQIKTSPSSLCKYAAYCAAL